MSAILSRLTPEEAAMAEEYGSYVEFAERIGLTGSARQRAEFEDSKHQTKQMKREAA